MSQKQHLIKYMLAIFQWIKTYGILAWGGATGTYSYIKALDTAHKILIRTMFKKPYPQKKIYFK